MHAPSTAALLEEIRDSGDPPRHVAIIMDGNGRWARGRLRNRTHGHRAGLAAARDVVEGAMDAGVRDLTLFAFSEENWRRPHSEVSALMTLMELNLRDGRADELRRRGIGVRVLGDPGRLPSRLRAAVRRMNGDGTDGARLHLNLAVSYGARTEIVRAARRLAERVERGTLTAAEIDERLFAANLYTAGLPDPELLVRTSGEQRISNFLLWQIAYTELYITPVLWPDFRRRHLYEAILDYQRRDRRFGRVADPTPIAPHASR